MRTLRALLLLSLVSTLTRSGSAQTRAGLIDVSGVQLYWRAADAVSSGHISPDSAQTQLATHAGYQQIDRSGSRLRVMLHCFRLMVPGASKDTIPIPVSSRAWLYPRVCDHLVSAHERRDSLEQFAAALSTAREERGQIASALDSARAYLPPPAQVLSQPVVYALLFEDNGFGGESIAIDLLSYLRRSPDARAAFLAHEFYHALRVRLPSDVRLATSGEALPAALRWMVRTQEEGIASLLDKRRYVVLDEDGPMPAASAREGFPREHAERVAAGRSAISRLDSVFTKLDALTIADSAATHAIEQTIADGGHALGQYMALAIEAHAGRSALRESSVNRFAFIRAYQRAATANPRAFARFSETAMRYLAQLEQRYATTR